MKFTQNPIDVNVKIANKVFGLNFPESDNGMDYSLDIVFELDRIDFVLTCSETGEQYMKQFGYDEFEIC